MTDDSLQQSYPPTWLGWVARIASLVALVGLLTVLVKEAFDAPRPVDFQINIRQNDIRKVNVGFAAPIEITKIGKQAALEVKFEVKTTGQISQIASTIIGPN